MDSIRGPAMFASGRLWATSLAIIALIMLMACASEPEATPAPSATAIPVSTVNSVSPVPTVASAAPEPTVGLATPVPISDPLPKVRAEVVFPSVSFDRMVYLTHPEGMPGRLYLVLQPGRIMVFDNVSNPSSPTTFLDIRGRVSDRGNEEGLLGLAFDPDYRDNGYLYVYYSAASPRRSIIARYHAPPGTGNVDPSTEKFIMQIGQPFSNHNGGHVTFGPDGYLYVGLGDGGSGGDPRGHGQNLRTLLGTILRIDVSTLDETGAYAVPQDNPFVEVEGARPEIWAYGLRNPWRFSFDRETGKLWAGDVGQNKLEEIDIVTKGGNYGWNIMEGSSCFRDNSCGGVRSRRRMLGDGRVRLPGQSYPLARRGLRLWRLLHGAYLGTALRWRSSHRERADSRHRSPNIVLCRGTGRRGLYPLVHRRDSAAGAPMMEVRRYRAPDRDAVWDLHNIALNEVGAHAGNGPWDDDLHRIEAEFISNGDEFYVGVIDGRIVAMGALKRLTDIRGEICRMRVHPDFQRRGLGGRMLSMLEGQARELGFRTLSLDTTVGQVAAMSMYLKAGYEEVARGRKFGFAVVEFEKQI